jgi:outer membrane protein
VVVANHVAVVAGGPVRRLIVPLVVATLALAAPTAAQSSRFSARVRVLGAVTDDHSDEITNTGTKVQAGNAAGGEIGVAYLVTPKLGLELSVAALPVKLSTTGGLYPGLDVGTVTLSSGMLALGYHFATTGRIKPYLAVGVAFARPTGYSVTSDMRSSGISNLTFSTSLRMHTQAGADIEIGKGWLLNVDFRYVPVTTSVDFHLTAGGVLDTIALDLNPIMVGVGVGRSF